MKHHIVLYRINSIMSDMDDPFQFRCMADNADHAEEQCINAYPDADVVWIEETTSTRFALQQYYDI